MGIKQFDWAQIKMEYITGNIGQKALAKKHGVSLNVLQKYATKEKWVEEKRKYALRVVEKAVQKEVNRQANALAKELRAADKMSDAILKALEDDKQFNRWIVTEGGDGYTITDEKVFEKVDMRSMKDAVATLKMIEQLKRSVQGLLTLQEETQRDIALRKIALEEKKAAAEENTDTTVTIRFEGDELKEWSE
jgi:hypothetical protein